MRVPTSDDGEVKEVVVPKRSLASLLENFTRGDVYTVLVNRVPTDDATEHTVLEV